MNLLKQDKKTQTFTAILYWEEDVYVAECPEVGTACQGETIAVGTLKSILNQAGVSVEEFLEHL